jgi:hypothetical protein
MSSLFRSSSAVHMLIADVSDILAAKYIQDELIYYCIYVINFDCYFIDFH